MAPSKRSAPNDSDDDSDNGQRRARDPSSTPHGSAVLYPYESISRL
jgi:hypothetical protein